MVDVKTVLLNYKIGGNISIKKINSGRTSQVYQIISNEKTWILRTLRDETQGLLEFEITNHIREKAKGIVPRIICTKEGHPFVKAGSDLYQLQEYIPGQTPPRNKEVHSIIGKVTGQFHSAMESFESNRNQRDRFHLMELWEMAQEKWESLRKYSPDIVPNLQDMESKIDELAIVSEHQPHFIHGDLGTWNMLFDHEGIRFIDFGDSRKGHFYFDLAAAITSSIPETCDRRTQQQAVFDVLKGYETHREKIETDRLYTYIELWIYRGVLATLAYTNTAEQAVSHFVLLKQMENLLKK